MLLLFLLLLLKPLRPDGGLPRLLLTRLGRGSILSGLGSGSILGGLGSGGGRLGCGSVLGHLGCGSVDRSLLLLGNVVRLGGLGRLGGCPDHFVDGRVRGRADGLRGDWLRVGAAF